MDDVNQTYSIGLSDVIWRYFTTGVIVRTGCSCYCQESVGCSGRIVWGHF